MPSGLRLQTNGVHSEVANFGVQKHIPVYSCIEAKRPVCRTRHHNKLCEIEEKIYIYELFKKILSQPRCKKIILKMPKLSKGADAYSMPERIGAISLLTPVIPAPLTARCNPNGMRFRVVHELVGMVGLDLPVRFLEQAPVSDLPTHTAKQDTASPSLRLWIKNKGNRCLPRHESGSCT